MAVRAQPAEILEKGGGSGQNLNFNVLSSQS